MVKSSRKSPFMLKNLLSIAGYDPSGGAGVGLDIRVFKYLGFRGFGILTSATAQNAVKMIKTFHLPGGFVFSQFEALAAETRFAGIKVGMAGTLENLAAIARILASNPSIPRVIDPVFKPSSGAPILEKKAIPKNLEIVRGRSSLITPNLDEASALSGFRVRTVDDMKEAARRIHDAGLIPCLVKGGHLPGRAVDVLYDGQDFLLFRHARIRKRVHGTGCFLSAAILGYMARGCDLKKACRLAMELTGLAIRKAVPAGKGRAVFSFPA
jgi:hydroxymethylpyrimidine/phosphomethylpyrimidine kinase